MYKQTDDLYLCLLHYVVESDAYTYMSSSARIVNV